MDAAAPPRADEETRSLTSSEDGSERAARGPDAPPKPAKQQALPWRTVLGYLAVLLVGIALGRGGNSPGPSPPPPPPPCDSSGLAPIPKLLDERSWVYDELGPEETKAVASFVARELGVQPTFEGGFAADALSGTEGVTLLPPPKAAARAFVDGAASEPPPRFAKVCVVRVSSKRPDVMEYKVGPIVGCNIGRCDRPSLRNATITPLLADGAVALAKRPYDINDATWLPPFLAAVAQLQHLLIGRFGKIFDWIPGCLSACHDPALGRSQPLPFNDITSTNVSRVFTMRISWYRSASEIQAQWLHELPFSFRLNQTGVAPAATAATDFYLCGRGPYPSAAALLAAAPSIPDCFKSSAPLLNSSGRAGDWDVPGLGPNTPPRAGSTLPPPRQSCSRRRFKLGADAGGNNGRLVSWLGWTFFATVRPSSGLALMDLRFKNRRVAHELALAEAAAFYSGSGADQVLYLDSAYSMTQLSTSLIPGVDCPADAAYLNGTTWAFSNAVPFEPDAARLVRSKTPGGAGHLGANPLQARPFKAACVFEADRATSQWRHTQNNGLGQMKADGVSDTALIVRMVSTVGNYDYLTEVAFHTDGSIKTSMIFAGYCEVRWFGRDVNPWEAYLGAVAHANVAAPLHSHFASFKVDLDVLGESNSFEKTDFKVGKPRGVPGLEAYPTKYIERRLIPSEGVGVSTVVGGEPSIWRIVNKAARGAHPDAATPGYAILPASSASQQLPRDHPLVTSASFSRYNLAVTRRYDSEARASSIYDLFGQSSAPYFDFDTYLANNESIEDKDLVAWVTIGKEHLPRSEDIPLITNFGTSFLLWPWDVFATNAGSQDMPRVP